MFSNIHYGWADFKFGDFNGKVSYIGDPIFEIGEILLEYKQGIVIIDEEGTEFDIILKPLDAPYVVSNSEEKYILYEINDYYYNDFAIEFINDIERDLEDWVNWLCYHEWTEEELQERRNNIIKLINDLKKVYIKEGE